DRRRLVGSARAESQPLRRARDARRRHVAEHVRQRRGVGARSAAAQARREDAGPRSHRGAGQGRGGISHEIEVMAERAEPGTFYRSPPTARAGLAVPVTTTVLSWLTTVDHKRIGILYGVSALTFFLIGGIEALIIRLQLVRPHAGIVSAETFNALFTMHGTTMVFLAIMPLNAAFFNYMIPLMIGA